MFCTCMRPCACADDVKLCTVEMRNAILRNYLKHTFLQKLVIPENMKVYIHCNTCGKTRSWGGGYFCVQKLEIPGRRLHEIPFVV